MILSIPSARSDDIYHNNNDDYTSSYYIKHSSKHHDAALNNIVIYMTSLPIATVALSAIIDKWEQIVSFCENEIHKIENTNKQ